MQVSFNTNPDLAVEGQLAGQDKVKTTPRSLALLPQITRVRFTAGSETDDTVLTVTDVETGKQWTVTGTGSATEATMLDNLMTAFLANYELSQEFTATEDGVDDFVLTARHTNREYTVTCTGGPSTTPPAVTNTQEAGGSGIPFGVLVAKGSTDLSFQAIDASTVLADIAGALYRTEANTFHSLENDNAADLDLTERGWHYPILEEGVIWVKVEDAVTPSSSVFVRRAQTAGAGTVGKFRGTAAGTAQVSTVAPTVNHQHYAFSFEFEGEQFDISYTATDATTAVADAIDGLYDNVVEQLTAAGIETVVVASESDTLLTLTVAAGREIKNLRNAAHGLDTEAVSCVVTQGAADVDTIDVSSICEYLTTAAADGLAMVKINK